MYTSTQHFYISSAGGKEVEEQDDLFILVAPQNAVGNCIIDVSIYISRVEDSMTIFIGSKIVLDMAFFLPFCCY